jgi:hypothetical protein
MNIKFYAVIAPGVNSEKVSIEPEIVKLDWAFAAVSDDLLIDTIASVGARLKALDKWLEAAKGVLKTRLEEPAEPGQETVTQGKLFEAHYSLSTRTALDQEKVKEDLGDRYPEFCKTTPVLTLKIVPITATPTTGG